MKLYFLNIYRYLYFVVIISIIILLHVFGLIENQFMANNFSDNIPPKTEDTIYTYDTVYVYDTVFENDTMYIYEYIYQKVHIKIIPDIDSSSKDTNKLKIDTNYQQSDTTNQHSNSDTFFISPQKNNLFKNLTNSSFLKNSKYKASYNFSISYNIDKYSKLYANQEFNYLYKQSFRPSISQSHSIGFEMINNNIIYQTGIYYNRIHEDFYFDYQYVSIYLQTYYKYFQNYSTKADTIYFIDLDAYLQGDTIWIPYYYDVYNFFKDSVLSSNIDTAKININYTNSNRYSYVEFPFIVGKNFNIEKHNFGFKLGIFAAYLHNISAKTLIYNTQYQMISLDRQKDMHKFSLILFSSFFYQKDISQKFNIGVEIFCRQNMTSLTLAPAMKKYFLQGGITFSLLYRIN